MRSNSYYRLVFLLPLLQAFEVNIGGRLFYYEILIIFMFPFFYMFNRKVFLNKLPNTFLKLCFLWLLAQIFSNIVNNVPLIPFLKGIGTILITMITFSFFYLLFSGYNKKYDSILIFTLGYGFGNIIDWIISPKKEQYIIFWWKHGIDFGVTFLLIFLSTWFWKKKKINISLLFMFLASGANFIFGTRSLAGICLLVFMLIFYNVKIKKIKNNNINYINVLKNVLLIILIVLVVLNIYGYLAGNGFLGEFAKEKYDEQGKNPYLVLFSGRMDQLAMLISISEKPLTGYGSNVYAESWLWDKWFILMNRYAPYLSYRDRIATSYEKGKLVTHSFLLGNWAEAGFLGGIVWIWVLLRLILVIIKINNFNNVLYPLLMFLAFLTIWNILFSPFNTYARFITAYSIAALFSCYQKN